MKDLMPFLVREVLMKDKIVLFNILLRNGLINTLQKIMYVEMDQAIKLLLLRTPKQRKMILMLM